MATQTKLRLFDVDEYYAMAEAGILSEDDRVELLDGEIVTMAPISSLHAILRRHVDSPAGLPVWRAGPSSGSRIR